MALQPHRSGTEGRRLGADGGKPDRDRMEFTHEGGVVDTLLCSADEDVTDPREPGPGEHDEVESRVFTRSPIADAK